jgi:hydroxymethylglutaryl-CoA reductase
LAGETVNAAKAATETAEKVGIFKKMFDKGASFARTMHNRHAGQTLTDTAKSIGANMLAEGVEEVTEELLYDVTKSTFNILSEFSGGTKVSAWDNILERYGQSFFGGMLGGGIFEATNAYHIARPKLEG